MLTNELTLSLFGIGFKFFFEDKKTKNRVEKYFSPFLRNIPPQHVFWVEKEKIRIDQTGGNEIFPETFPLIDALLANINALLFKEVSEFLIIHAGSVKKEGRLLFVPGFSGSGKSTTTAFFVLRGWEFLGDDLIFINLKDNKIYPYPIPLRLKNPPQKLKALAESASDLKAEKFIWESQDFLYLLPERSLKTSFDLEDLDALLFPLFSPGKSFSLQQLNATDIFKRLLTHSINFPSCPREAFDLAFALSKKAVGHEITFGRFEHLEHAVREEVLWTTPSP
jgi:hypothetical protein